MPKMPWQDFILCVGFRTGQLMHNEVFAHLVFAVRTMGLALVAE